MTQEEARKLIVKALYSDSWLYEHLVFKGGNALSLVYNVGNRSSLDLDFSIENDFGDLKKVSNKIENTLTSTFGEVGILVFDFTLSKKPKSGGPAWWGGYRVEFKLISKPQANKLDFRIEDMRRQAITIDGGSQRRIYSIEISKFEFIAGKVQKKVDGVDIFVYSPLLLAVEKLRALLQQHPDYAQISANLKRSRARDLYDIWALSDYFSIQLEMYLSTVENVFNAKRVDMGLLNKLSDVKELHRASWSDVELTVSSGLEDFDFYYNFVNSSAINLYTQWIKNPP